MRAWAVPLLLGVLTFAGVLGTVRLTPGLPEGEAALLAVFPHAVVDPAAPGVLLAVWNASTPDGPFARLPVTAPGPVTVDGRVLASASLAAPGAHFGRHGHNATAITFHAFTADGRLLASNAPPEGFAGFHRHGDFRHLGPVTLYLGDGAAANGTYPRSGALAPLAGPLREALAGQPEGGVAVARLGHGAVAALYGPVTLAVRVDRLLLAP